MLARLALVLFPLTLSACAGQNPPLQLQARADPDNAITTGATQSVPAGGSLRAVSPLPSSPDDLPATSSFHRMMQAPYDPASAKMLASIAVDDGITLNPDGSYRLPPPVHIPVIDISQSHSALTGNDVYRDDEPVDISVPW